MECLAADHKPTLDLVPMCVTLLIRHCIDGRNKQAQFDANLTPSSIKEKLIRYESKLVQKLTIIAAYLNPQITKPTDAIELKSFTDLFCDTMQLRYSAGLSRAPKDATLKVKSTFFFASMLHSSLGADGTVDEIGKHLSVRVFQSKGFLDILSWLSARQALLPVHYQMAIDHLGMPGTLMPSDRVNCAAGREFMCFRQSPSSSVLFRAVCVQSWTHVSIINSWVSRAAATVLASKEKNKDNVAVVLE